MTRITVLLLLCCFLAATSGQVITKYSQKFYKRYVFTGDVWPTLINKTFPIGHFTSRVECASHCAQSLDGSCDGFVYQNEACFFATINQSTTVLPNVNYNESVYMEGGESCIGQLKLFLLIFPTFLWVNKGIVFKYTNILCYNINQGKPQMPSSF